MYSTKTIHKNMVKNAKKLEDEINVKVHRHWRQGQHRTSVSAFNANMRHNGLLSGGTPKMLSYAYKTGAYVELVETCYLFAEGYDAEGKTRATNFYAWRNEDRLIDQVRREA